MGFSCFVLSAAVLFLPRVTVYSAPPAAAKFEHETLEILQWFSGLGFENVKGMQPVKVWTGGYSQGESKAITPITALGFLAGEDGKRFTVITTDLIRWEFQQSGAPLPEYARAYFEKRTLDEIVEHDLDPTGDGWSGHLADGPWPLPREKMFILACCCWQNGRNDLAEKLLARAKQFGGDDGRYDDKPLPFREALVKHIAYFRFQTILLDFGNPKTTRATLVEELEAFVAHFPNVEDAARAKRLAAELQDLIREEKDHPPQDKSDVSKLEPVERARVLVGRLRDEFFSTREENSAYSQLAKLGESAVPALIDALDDRRPTRCVSFMRCGSGGMGPDPGRLQSIGDMAETLLSCVAQQIMPDRRFVKPPTYRYPGAERAKTPTFKEEVQKAWAEYQGKGALQYMLDGIAKGGEEAKAQARELMRKFPDKAAFAIVRHYATLTSAGDRSNLIYGGTGMHDPAWMTLLRQEAEFGMTLGVKAAAAFCLRMLGDEFGVGPMLKECKNLLGKESGHYGGSGEVIRFLASSADETVIAELSQNIGRRPDWAKREIISGLSGAYGANVWNKGKTASPSVKALIEKILVECLNDDHDVWGGAFVGYHDPCVGDDAARCLAQLLPGRYRFDHSDSFAKRTAARLECLNQWRRANHLEPIQPPNPPTVPDNERNKITEVVFADDYLRGTATQASIEKLKGQPLEPNALVGILCDFGTHLPDGVIGFRIRAMRNSTPNGVALKIWAVRGRNPEPWESFWSQTGIERDQKRITAGGGTCQQQDLGKTSRWKEFVATLDKALAEPADKELIVRVGLCCREQVF